jgi:hypothetical protein
MAAILELILAGLLTWEDMSIEQAEAVLHDPNAKAEEKKKAEEQLERIQRRHDPEEDPGNNPLADPNSVSDYLPIHPVDTYSFRLNGKMELKKIVANRTMTETRYVR